VPSLTCPAFVSHTNNKKESMHDIVLCDVFSCFHD
jgi:hypothetical protein